MYQKNINKQLYIVNRGNGKLSLFIFYKKSAFNLYKKIQKHIDKHMFM